MVKYVVNTFLQRGKSNLILLHVGFVDVSDELLEGFKNRDIYVYTKTRKVDDA